MNTPSISQWLEQLHSDGVHLDLPQLLRYQHQTHFLDLAPKQTIQSKLAGTYLARSKGRGMEFDEVRHYQNGDDVRTIDWRVTARTGKVHTKLFREEKERPVFVLTDLSDSMQMGSQLLFKSVQAAHLAALIGWHARERGDKFGGVVFNQQTIRELKPAARHTGVLRYLQQLQLLNQPVDEVARSVTLADALAQLRQLCRPGSLIYVISDFQQASELCWKHLQAIRAHNEIRLCHILDPLDLKLPTHADPLVAVKDTTGAVEVDLADSKMHERYAEQQADKQQSLLSHCRGMGLSLLTISTAVPLAEQFRQHQAGYTEGAVDAQR